MGTFVDFISTWINLLRQKSSENTLLSNKSNHYFTFSNIGIQIYDIQQSILKSVLLFINFILEMSCFLRKIRASRTLSQYTLLVIVTEYLSKL